MKVRFWGVRGSIPVPGTATAGYGGNTSCVEVQAPGAPSVVFDCGTGARLLGRELVRRPERKLYLLFSHYHLDHLFGFPFFAPIFAPSFQMVVMAPGFSVETPRDRLGRYLNGVFHPLRLPEIPATLNWDVLPPTREFELEPYRFQTIALNHPGGASGYRVDANGRSVCYLTDTAPFARPQEGLTASLAPTSRERQLIQLMQGADLVIFDTMFTLEEYLEKMTWGHAYPEYAVSLCAAAQVKTLCLFHHAPDASDDILEALEARWRGYPEMRVILAREGQEVNLEG